MSALNLHMAWLGMGLGVLAGAVQGLFFHQETWLGGYASWPRRMLRLGHVSFLGVALLNLAFALTPERLAGQSPLTVPSAALAAGNLLMPAVCYLCAWRKPLRHLFVLPVLCIVLGVWVMTWRIW